MTCNLRESPKPIIFEDAICRNFLRFTIRDMWSFSCLSSLREDNGELFVADTAVSIDGQEGTGLTTVAVAEYAIRPVGLG